ncbi:MAG: integrase core domain-containing protein [Longimicrobiales bacterium]
MQDGYSRFLLECRGMLRLDLRATLQRFRALFRAFGLPQCIRTDNGHPFASNAIARLSKLSVWWVTLGIIPEFIEPGKPQQNQRHERMHRDLKRETALPPRANLRAQQRRFNEFRRIFNFERPHEGLGMDIPSERFRPSPRSYEETPKPLEYPAHFEVRLVSQDSTIRWNSRKVFVSHLLGRRHVGLEQVAEAVWSVYCGPIHLGWLDEADYRIMDVMERKRRRR